MHSTKSANPHLLREWIQSHTHTHTVMMESRRFSLSFSFKKVNWMWSTDPIFMFTKFIMWALRTYISFFFLNFVGFKCTFTCRRFVIFNCDSEPAPVPHFFGVPHKLWILFGYFSFLLLSRRKVWSFIAAGSVTFVRS